MTAAADIRPAPEGAAGGPPAISVIVPHLNQHAELARCLAALAAQTGRYALREVIVVDNGSDRSPEPVVLRFPGVRLLTEREAGPGPARNLGAKAATGEILAFVDADCTARADWLAAITAAHARAGGRAILGGDVRVPVAGRRRTMLEAYEAVYHYRMKTYLARDGFTGTGNLAVSREIFRAVGPFAGIDVAEDVEWCRRATAAGHPIRHVPEMVVYHPARRSFAGLAAKWDRHLAHQRAAHRAAGRGPLAWSAKAIAIALSPPLEVPRILLCGRIDTPRDRLLAFACLVRVRLYRARRMIALAAGAGPTAGAWNRDADGAASAACDPQTDREDTCAYS